MRICQPGSPWAGSACVAGGLGARALIPVQPIPLRQLHASSAAASAPAASSCRRRAAASASLQLGRGAHRPTRPNRQPGKAARRQKRLNHQGALGAWRLHRHAHIPRPHPGPARGGAARVLTTLLGRAPLRRVAQAVLCPRGAREVAAMLTGDPAKCAQQFPFSPAGRPVLHPGPGVSHVLSPHRPTTAACFGARRWPVRRAERMALSHGAC